MDGGTVLARESCPAPLAGSALTGLPLPCLIEIGGESHDCAGGKVHLMLPAGEYVVKVWA
jgi:hypothetical protein